jgi:hypothetical protein
MRLITYRRDATAAPALLKDGHVFPLKQLGYPDALAFIAAGPSRWASVNVQLEETGLNLLAPLTAVSLEPPVSRPGKIPNRRWSRPNSPQCFASILIR